MAGPQIVSGQADSCPVSGTESSAPGALWPSWQTKGILSSESFRPVDNAHLLGCPRGDRGGLSPVP